MNQRITRRRFGQLAIASTAVAGISTFASRLMAQTPPPVLVGVNLGRQASSATTPGATTVSSRVFVQTLALRTGEIQERANLQVQAPATTQPQSRTNLSSARTAQPLQPYAQLGGLTSMADGTLILSSNPVGSGQQANPSRLTTIVGSSSQTIKVSGLDPQNALWSLLVTNDGSLLGLVANKNGKPPYRLANVNAQTGQVSFINFTLPSNEWFSSLTQCPNGNIYLLSAGFGGGTSLVQLDLGQGQVIRLPQRLRLNNVDWNTGLLCRGSTLRSW